MPIVNSHSACFLASSAASSSTAESSLVCLITWSAGSIIMTAPSPPREPTSAAARAAQGPVSRPTGSPTMFPTGRSGSRVRTISTYSAKEWEALFLLLLPQFNTCSSSGVFDRLLMKKSFDLLRLFLNASHMGFCMFFKLSIPFCRRSFGKGRFQIPVQ